MINQEAKWQINEWKKNLELWQKVILKTARDFYPNLDHVGDAPRDSILSDTFSWNSDVTTEESKNDEFIPSSPLKYVGVKAQD